MTMIDKVLLEQKKANYVVKLITNSSYTTYQFYALMANRSTPLEDGLRFAALTTIDWIKKRLGEENIPEELKMPSASEYKDYSTELKGYYFNDGYLLNIISIPKEGIWTLQLIEPDMSSQPGDDDPIEKAMPGRTFTTNIGFYINRETGRLECGFQTIVSQPKTESKKARVYRLAIIRKLMNAEIFGFEQGYRITDKPIIVDNKKIYKSICEIINSESNQLPIVGYCSNRKINVSAYDLGTRLQNPMAMGDYSSDVTSVDDLARERFSFGFFCLFDDRFIQELKKDFGEIVADNEIFLIHPKKYGGRIIVPAQNRISETILKYPSEKPYSFGAVKFVSEARAIMFEHSHSVEDLSKENSELFLENNTLKHQLSLMSENKNVIDLKNRLSEHEEIIEELKRTIEEKNEKIRKLKEANEQLKKSEASVKDDLFKLQNDNKKTSCGDDDENEGRMHLKEKPNYINGKYNIVNYFESTFSDRLVFHEEAKKSLKGCYIEDKDLWNLFFAFSTILWELKYNDVSSKNIDEVFQNKTGFELALKAGMMTEDDKEKMRQRIRLYKEKEIDISPHVTLKCGEKSNQSVHFAWIDQEKKIMIGHCGEHLEVYRKYK